MRKRKKPRHKQSISLLILSCVVSAYAVSQEEPTMTNSRSDNSLQLCADKPNCVSTLDNRPRHQLVDFYLKPHATLTDIAQVVSAMKNSHIAVQKKDYLRVEFTSSVFKFVDDLELRIKGQVLIVRSESRTGYYDFNVNRKRAEALRHLLKQAGLIQ